MYIDKYREVIETSNMNIPEKLKEIDDGYFVVRNHYTRKFEVHNSHQVGNTLAINIPYPELDSRTVRLVKETRIENAKKILKEIEEHNKKIEKENKRKLNEYIEDTSKQIHKYCSTHESKDTIDEDSELLKKKDNI